MELREWFRDLTQGGMRYLLKYGVRYEALVRARQQDRYLALGQLLTRPTDTLLPLSAFELSVFSQNGEDGVLQELLRRVGVENRYFVEIGAGRNEANCLLLADVFGWRGVLVDTDPDEVRELSYRYKGVPRIRVIQEYVTPANIETILERAHVPQRFDVLSIDVDGNDYWLWRALERFHPRVVIIEHNASLPSDREIVQPYLTERPLLHTDWFGASLGALRALGTKKGYQLVHVELTGTNAFFLREDLVGESFPPEDEVVARAPNYFLDGRRHRRPPFKPRYLEMNSIGGPSTHPTLPPDSPGSSS